MADIVKSPRVFVQNPLSEGATLILEDSVHHYLKNVMRVVEGGAVRVFNGRDGEFCARIEKVGKKSIETTIENKLRDQKNPERKIHLLFTPIKKERMDFMVEKAVELGATDLHIVLTQNTDQRKVNMDRIEAQIVEAAEQCERMDIPSLHASEDVFKKLASWDSSVPLFAAIERFDAKLLRDVSGAKDCAVLIGPAGGFSDEEKQKLGAMKNITPVSLGENILRTETAALAALSILSL